jgi:peroxiredoxin
VNVLLLVAVVYGIAMMRTPTRTPPSAYTPGEQAPAIAGLPYAGARRTAVLFVRSTCHFCTESMGFYRELAKGRRVVAISNDAPDVLDRYLTDNGLTVPRATVARGAWAKLSGTPTIVVVDAAGRVVKSWVGALSPDGQRDLIATLN